MALFGKKNEKENNSGQQEPLEKAEGAASGQSGDIGRVQKAETPENFNFNRYFLAERRIVLDNISYETLRPVSGEVKLNIKDTIVAQVRMPTGVKITYNRALSFEPDGIFALSVTFGVMLVFNPGVRDEVDWHTVDVAGEFKKNCPQLVDVMASKAALLIAEITNANNGNPMILRK